MFKIVTKLGACCVNLYLSVKGYTLAALEARHFNTDSYIYHEYIDILRPEVDEYWVSEKMPGNGAPSGPNVTTRMCTIARRVNEQTSNAQFELLPNSRPCSESRPFLCSRPIGEHKITKSFFIYSAEKSSKDF